MQSSVEQIAKTDAGLASALRVSVGRLSRRIRNERDPENQLSVGQLAVLMALKREGDCTISELARQERVQPPSMTRTVTLLEECGYVTREEHPDDGRQVLVRLADKGKGTLAQDRKRRDAWLALRLAELTAEERAVLRDAAPILERLGAG
jgi:DNA-binding MarR family transcriptional regulator